MTTDTPRNACPHCGAESYVSEDAFHDADGNPQWRNITRYECGSTSGNQAQICFEREYRKKAEAEVDDLLFIRKTLAENLEKSQAEVERLTGRMKEAEDLIEGLHEGWKKARKSHLLTCKNAQAEIDKLHTKNVCLQELIQEFYEWTKRDYPTEQEVREIMNRYHDLLNK